MEDGFVRVGIKIISLGKGSASAVNDKMDKKYSVVFIRHGESEWNKINLFCGWHDVGLSEEGEREFQISFSLIQASTVTEIVYQTSKTVFYCC